MKVYDFNTLISGILNSKKIHIVRDIQLKAPLRIKISNIKIYGNNHCFYDNEINILGNNNTIKNLKIYSSPKCGIKISGNNNTLVSVIAMGCKRTGIQICNGGSKNKIINCYSGYNDSNTGDADGFACKLNSGKGNVFIFCQAWHNEDDGFDLFAAGDSVKLIGCESYYNNNGSGFKLGGFKSEEDLRPKIHHKLIDCLSIGNGNYGFSNNNQVGKITLKNCRANHNKKEDYFFPRISHPKNKNELRLGDSFLINCMLLNTTKFNIESTKKIKWKLGKWRKLYVNRYFFL